MTGLLFAKPERGSARLARESKRAKSKTHERAQKAIVRKRDGNICRLPGCTEKRYLEVAHLRHKSMGGNPANDRSVANQMILLCQIHHRGSFSLDSGDIEIVPIVVSLGTDGPCMFRKSTICEGGAVTLVTFARELSIGITEARS